MKITLWAIVILVGGLIAGTFFLLENPDRFKDQISRTVSAHSDYELQIRGELGWRYWPPIAIEASDVRISIAGAEELARFGAMEIDVDLLPLLTQRRIIDINRMRLSDGEISLLTDEDGKQNWQPEANATSANSPPGANEPALIPPTLHELVLNNIALSYSDASTQTEYLGTIGTLQTSELEIGKPFDFSLSAEFSDHQNDVALSATGRMIYRDSDKIAFDDTLVSGSFKQADQTLPEFQIRTSGEWYADRQSLTLRETSIAVGTLRLITSGLLNLASSSPHYDGVMELESADLTREAETLGLTLPIKTLQFSTGIYASADHINLTDLAGQFDNSPFTGRLKFSPDTIATLEGDIRLEQLNTAEYLDTSADHASTDGTATSADGNSVIVPADQLRTLNLDLITRIRHLTHDGDNFDNTKIEVTSDARLLKLTANTEAYGGRLVAEINTYLEQRVVSDIRLSLDRLDLKSLTEVGDITGSLTGHSDLQFDGTTLADLADTISGKSTFTVTDGTLNVTPIKRIAATIDQLRGKTSRIAEWPDIVPFDHMAANHLFSEGTRSGQLLTSQLENLNFTAQGGFDPIKETIGYEVTARFEQGDSGRFSVSDQMAGVRWPMNCEGKFSASVTELCFGDDDAIRDLVADLVKQELRNRGQNKLEELIDEKVPDELKDLTKELFKNLFDR